SIRRSPGRHRRRLRAVRLETTPIASREIAAMTNALRSDTARASSSTAEPVAFSKLLSLLRWIDDDYADEATFRLLRRELGAAQRPALFGTVVLQSDTAPVAVICVTWSRWYVHASRWRLIRGPRPTSEKVAYAARRCDR